MSPKRASFDRDLAGYSLEKLGAAVQVLATHPSGVRWRLLAAAEHLALVQPRGLPPHLRQIYERVWHRMTHRRDGRKAPMNRSVLHGMRDSTGSKLAAAICRLESELGYVCDNDDERDN